VYPFIVGMVFLLAFVAVFIVLKKLLGQKSAGGGLQTSIRNLDSQISAANEGLEQGFAHIKEMVSLDVFQAKEKELAALNKQLNSERLKLEKLDRQVEKLQASVESEEASHNDRKRGKEEAASLADQVRENTQRLASEYSRLEQELNQSLSQLTALNTEVELTNEQKIALDSVYNGVRISRDQLSTLADVHTQAALRFTNLESQYQELEKEFTKLVEKELSGDA
jgi:chromosome segregation ATPase